MIFWDALDRLGPSKPQDVRAWSKGFADAIGGYPAQSVVLTDDETRMWVSLFDDNCAEPQSGESAWLEVKLPTPDEVTWIPNSQLMIRRFRSPLRALKRIFARMSIVRPL